MHRSRQPTRATVAISVGIAAALVLIPACAGGGPASFTTSDLPLPPRIFDLGVGYIDDDPHPDLFTTAHNNRQVVLIGDGEGGFEDRISELRLDHTRAFPGLEWFNEEPALTDPGLYLFATPDGLTLVAHEVASKATLRSRGLAAGEGRNGATVALERRDRSLAPGRVDFEAPPGGEADLSMRPPPLPVRVEVRRPSDAARIYVGAEAVPATSGGFRLLLRDRHGVAWTDFDGDDDSDAYIVRGGIGNKIGDNPNLVQDELMVQEGGVFRDMRRGSGIRKGTCRSRAAAAIDADGNGWVDLFASCKQGNPRLYLQGPGGFRNASRPLARAGASGGAMRWVDVRGDDAPELVTVGRGSVAVFARRGHGWVAKQEMAGLPGDVNGIAPADFDRDGDADLLVVHGGETTLYRNREGKLRQRDPAAVGLPGKAPGPVAWVDYQNDGLLDVYAPGAGIFEQGPDGRFTATGLLAADDVDKAHTAWTDVDGDGDRDGIVAARVGGPRESKLHLNEVADGHWLQVDVRGGRALDAPGAQVTLAAGEHRQTGWVGESDSARFSSGERIVYFGLGDETTVDSLVVRWPDGARAKLDDVAADQRLTVPHP